MTTTGSSGSATGTGVSQNVNGFLLGWYANYHASAPGATTDIAIKLNEDAYTITTISNTATDAYNTTMKNIVDSAGAAVSGVYAYYPIAGPITVSVTGCDALTNAVVVTFYVAPN